MHTYLFLLFWLNINVMNKRFNMPISCLPSMPYAVPIIPSNKWFFFFSYTNCLIIFSSYLNLSNLRASVTRTTWTSRTSTFETIFLSYFPKNLISVQWYQPAIVENPWNCPFPCPLCWLSCMQMVTACYCLLHKNVLAEIVSNRCAVPLFTFVKLLNGWLMMVNWFWFVFWLRWTLENDLIW